MDQSLPQASLGRANVWFVMETGTMTKVITQRGDSGFWYVGTDPRGVELEVLAVEVPDGLLVTHAMPTALRGNHE